ncbi:MAG: VTT domain-containing protein [Parcubacteria group bacterium]|nr:VTT domain-containing protein [Parcubacteria group bacterium]
MFGVDLITLIITIGYIGLFGIIFAESGLFVGFFLPGDSLLFTAGFLASQKILDISVLIPLTFIAAVIGDSFGYTFGRRVGYKLFRKEDSIFFHKDHLERARIFYEKYGGKTIIVARFIPVVRTFAPILAGIGKMHYPSFLLYNIIGALVWATGVTFLGYFLGNAIPGIDKYLLPIILFIIVVSILPGVMHILRNKEDRSKIAHFVRNLLFKKK